MNEKVKITVNNAEYALVSKGEGESSIFFIHGITTNSFIWQKIIPHFEKEFKCFAIDLLGCGDSSKSLKLDYSLNSQAKNISEIIKKLNLGKTNVVCHDVGGGIGQILAVKFADVVKSLTLINSVAYDFWPVQPIIAMRTPIIRQIAMSTLDMGILKLIIKRGFYHKEKLTKELFSHYAEQMKTSDGRKAFLRFVRSLNKKELVDIAEDLTKLKVPVQIIRGDADVYLSKEISNKLHLNIPNSKLETIYTGGHYLMEDEPETVVTAMWKFFRSLSMQL